MASLLEQFGPTEPTADPVDADPNATQAPRSGSLVDQFTGGPEPVPVPEPGLGEEFTRGVAQGTDSLQLSLHGVNRMVGRELGIEALEQSGQAGIESNLEQLESAPAPSIGSTADIEDVGDFFKFAAAGIGQAVPSLATTIAGGGLGGTLAKKVVENSMRRTLLNRMSRTMVRKGFTKEAADVAARRAMSSEAGRKMLIDGVTRGTPRGQLLSQASRRGALGGAVAAGTAPQVGQIDVELQEAGVTGGKSALTAILGGSLGGALEAIPALRLIDKLFPGVDQALAKGFVRDLAEGMGSQALIEGGTEGAQEFIQLAALAFHDPSFDPFSEESQQRIIDAVAIGALVGGVTGGGAQLPGSVSQVARDFTQRRAAEPGAPLPDFTIEEGITDPDFQPADNTLFEEVQKRVRETVSNRIDPVVNQVRNSGQAALDQVRASLGPGINGEINRVAQQVSDAHGNFVTQHQELFDRVTTFAKDSSRRIYEQSELIRDPVARQGFIAEQLKKVDAEVQRVQDILKRNAATTEQATATRIDEINISFEDEISTARPTKFAFGKDKSGGRLTENDLFNPPEGEVQGFKTRKAARNLLSQLRTQFPSATDNTFAITEQQDGTFVVELNDPANAELLVEDDRISRGIESARKSARRNPDKSRQFQITNPDGTKTTLDMRTLVFAARDLEDVSTFNQGLDTVLGRLLERQVVTPEEVTALRSQFAQKDDRPLPRVTALDRELDALSPRTQKRIKAVLEETLDDEDLQGQDRAVRRQELLGEQLAILDEDPAAAREGEREEQGEEAAFLEEGLGRGLETETTQARRSARQRGQRRQPRAQRVAQEQTKQMKETFNNHEKLKVFMPGATPQMQQAVHDMTQFVQKTLGLKAEVRVINKAAIDRMAADNHADTATVQKMRELGVGAALDMGNGVTYIMLDELSGSPAAVGVTLAHELGHVLYNQEFNNLTRDGMKALRSAFVKDTQGRTKTNVRGRETPFVPDEAEFSEWMADQLAAWMVNDSKPQNQIERFFNTIAEKLEKLYDLINKNPGRFGETNETYQEFIDAVRAKVSSPDVADTRFFRNDAQPSNGFELPPLKVNDITISIPQRIPPGALDQAVKKFEADYPVIAKRANLLRNWIFNAYSLAAAPGNSVMLSIAKRAPAARKLVQIFGRDDHGAAKASQNFHQRVNLAKGNTSSRYVNATKNWTDADKESVVASLRAADGSFDPDIVIGGKAKVIRDLFDDLHNYLVDAGLPVGKIPNYFPRTFSRQKLVDNESVILTYLQDKRGMRPLNAQSFYNSLISEEAESAAALEELGKDPLASQSPAFRNMNSRTAQDPFFDQFLEDNLDAVVSNYIVAASKRAEFNRLLGQNSKAKKGWRARGKLDDILKDAETQGATEQDLKRMKQFIDANLGMLGRDFDKALPGARPIMAAFMAYQNMRVLAFTVFASLPDLVGPAIRTGDMRGTFDSVVKNIKELTSNKSDLHELARAYGVVSDAASEHIMTEYVDNHYMPPTLRKWNEAFFKYTGLESYTNFTRKMALAVGKDYIQNQARLVTEATTEKQRFRAKAALKELGLTKAQVDKWVADGQQTWNVGDTENTDQKVAEALVQFVDESIMRPNAAQRPIMSSHPAAMLVFHLKTYMYAMYEVVGRRMAHNFRVADTPAQILNVTSPALLMMALTAVGLELREFIQYAFSDREPPTDRMDGWDYTWELTERSGLLGPSQLAFDFESADRVGATGLAAIGGPTVGQFAQLISKPPSQTVPKAIPIVGQIPWLRDALREATPL